MFIVALSSIVNASNQRKCISLKSLKSEIQTTLDNLHLNEYSQEFHYNSFTDKLDRCVGSCNTLNDLSKKAFNNKTEDVNLSMFNMIKGMNEAKTLTKHLSVKNVVSVKKIIFGIQLHVIVKMENI